VPEELYGHVESGGRSSRSTMLGNRSTSSVSSPRTLPLKSDGFCKFKKKPKLMINAFKQNYDKNL
jgi:hypothetical protein